MAENVSTAAELFALWLAVGYRLDRIGLNSRECTLMLSTPRRTLLFALEFDLPILDECVSATFRIFLSSSNHVADLRR